MDKKNKNVFHYAQSCQAELSRFCAPLFNLAPIQAFTYYQKRHQRQQFLVLSTDTICLQQAYGRDSWLTTDWLQKDIAQASQDDFHSRVWSAGNHHAKSMLLPDHPYKQGLNVYQDLGNGHQALWNFASASPCDDLSLYFANHIDMFHLFATIFQRRWHRYISLSKEYYACHDALHVPSGGALMHDFLLATPLKQFPIMHRNTLSHVTHNEAICLHGLSQGKTAKVIGRESGLSYRTIEKHIENLKGKLQTNCRLEMVHVFNNSRGQWL